MLSNVFLVTVSVDSPNSAFSFVVLRGIIFYTRNTFVVGAQPGKEFLWSTFQNETENSFELGYVVHLV